MNKFIFKGYIGNIVSKKNYTKLSIAITRPYKNDVRTNWKKFTDSNTPENDSEISKSPRSPPVLL